MSSRSAFVPFALIVTLFFLWGVANNLNDILITQFKKAFALSDFQAGLVQSAFYLGYFLFALPAAGFMRLRGYKAAVVLGLVLYSCGAFLFWPAAQRHTYGLFLLALFVIASGLAFLETSANPFVTVLGPPSSAARRLNLAQAFNPLGSITGVLIGQHFIFSGIEHTPAQIAAMDGTTRAAYFATESAAVGLPYLVIGSVVLFWAVLIFGTRFPEVSPEPEPTNTTSAAGNTAADNASALRRNRRFILAVIAQFFYVGAQVGIWSFLIRYVQGTIPGTPEKMAAYFLTASLVAFMLGRFTGVALMRQFSPRRLLASFATVNIVLCGIAVGIPGYIGAAALVASSFFMSVMFPTIFALGIEGLGDAQRKVGSAFIVMAIIGGAFLPAVMGATSDVGGIHLAMGLPLLCFVVVLVFASLNAAYTRRTAQEAQ
ncbi:MAG: L-fucose:H+ symporter permease [Sinobacteraceae bacterium]|nr:L-fucose:H+ symporter permease [Nevskiaceae bacterium]